LRERSLNFGARRHALMRARNAHAERSRVDGELHSFGERPPARELRCESAHERIACARRIDRFNERRRNARELAVLHEHGAHRAQRDDDGGAAPRGQHSRGRHGVRLARQALSLAFVRNKDRLCREQGRRQNNRGGQVDHNQCSLFGVSLRAGDQRIEADLEARDEDVVVWGKGSASQTFESNA